jgi:hypothetical protein
MVAKGCNECRRRHIKCRFNAGSSACNNCLQSVLSCEQEPRYRFKEVDHVYQKEGKKRMRYDLSWEDSQVWVDVGDGLFNLVPSPRAAAPDADSSSRTNRSAQ